MIRDGWRADPEQPGRLIHDNLRGNGTRVTMAEHEAVSIHFKFRPLTPRQKLKPVAPIATTSQKPAPTEQPEG